MKCTKCAGEMITVGCGYVAKIKPRILKEYKAGKLDL